ncbi:MAG: hypothetical protein PHV30_08980 [Candidatus Margulisbacteria bacterium]|nr:hypothetical protein [Candidatus Margulisiibacteriota bacterium]
MQNKVIAIKDDFFNFSRRTKIKLAIAPTVGSILGYIVADQLLTDPSFSKTLSNMMRTFGVVCGFSLGAIIDINWFLFEYGKKLLARNRFNN